MEELWYLLAGFIILAPVGLGIAVFLLWRRVERLSQLLSQRPERAPRSQPVLPRAQSVGTAPAPWKETAAAAAPATPDSAGEVPAAPAVPATSARPAEPAAETSKPEDAPVAPAAAAVWEHLRRTGETRAAAAAQAAPPRHKAASPIAWERWVGVRGAGLLGGIAAALAGVLLFRHAMEVGWITPRLRVLTGLVGGALLVATGEVLRPRGYRAVPEALVGAGAVAIYAALWAASQLYAMWSVAVSFPAMAAVTALLCFAAVRRASAGAAVFALVGGFATPLLLATGEDPGPPHFAYLLLLNVALGFVAQRLSRAWLGLLAVCATVGLQALWFERHFEADELRFALGMLALFGILAAAAPRRGERPHLGAGVAARWIGLLAPFGFAVFLAGRMDLGPNPWPYILFALPLLAAAAFLARQRGLELLVSLAAVASLTLVFVLSRQPMEAPAALVPWVLGVPIFAALLHLFLELAHVGPGRATGSSPIRDVPHLRALSSALWILLLGAAVLPLRMQLGDHTLPFPWLLAATLALVVIAVRSQGVLLRLGGGGAHMGTHFALGALAVPALALGWVHAVQEANAALPPGPLWLHALGFVLPTLLWCVLTLRAPRPEDGRARGAGAPAVGAFASALVAMPLAAAVARLGPDFAHMAWAMLTAVSLPGLALAWALWERRTPPAAWLALAAAFVAHVGLGGAHFVRSEQPLGAWSAHPVAYFAAVGLLAAALAFAAARGRAALSWPSVGWSAALHLVFAFVFALQNAPLLGWRFGPALLALGFALLGAGLAACVPAARLRPRGHLASAAVVFAAAAAALAIDREVWLVGLSLAALGLGLLWRRWSTATPAWLGSAAAVLAALLLLRASLVSDRWPREAVPLLHTAGAVHLAVIVCCIGLAAALAPLGRAASLLRYAPQLAAGAGALAAFVAVSLAVIDLFGTGPTLWLPAQRDARLDLFLSLAWAGYALVLLVLGLVRRAAGPRWASLVILLVAILKVFLRDLGHLDGLARVGSLAGLALSLTLVSLLYQRFVFRRAAAAPV